MKIVKFEEIDNGLSAKALANVARFYADDYTLLAQLRDAACKTADCVRGITSILDRRADLLASLSENDNA